jgi:hypothetical protein
MLLVSYRHVQVLYLDHAVRVLQFMLCAGRPLLRMQRLRLRMLSAIAPCSH